MFVDFKYSLLYVLIYVFFDIFFNWDGFEFVLYINFSELLSCEI